MNMVMELDESGVYPIIPRIMMSALAEREEAKTECRGMDLSSIRVDDPRIVGIDWHVEGTAATPPPGESQIKSDIMHLMDTWQTVITCILMDQ